jgi:hypothetical protein
VQTINVEIKYKEVERGHTRQPDFFPWYRGVDAPLIHVGALAKSIAPPQVTKTEVLTKSTHSPSPERWVSNRLHQEFIEAPTISKSSQQPSKHQDHLEPSISKSNKPTHLHLTRELS